MFNLHDVDISKSKTHEISPRFKMVSQPKIPDLNMWNIQSFWTESVAMDISHQIYREFMSQQTRSQLFQFVINRGNQKIRGNDNIKQKTKEAHSLLEQNQFSYCKYEYRRDTELYQRVLLYLNSSAIRDVMSALVGQKLVSISDMFISVYFRGNFLAKHNDHGLGEYAFVNFMSQNWDFDRFGGTLNFLCPSSNIESCLRLTPTFNSNTIFKVFPENVPHFVEEVRGTWPRIAITGWYVTSDSKGVDEGLRAKEIGYIEAAVGEGDDLLEFQHDS